MVKIAMFKHLDVNKYATVQHIIAKTKHFRISGQTITLKRYQHGKRHTSAKR